MSTRTRRATLDQEDSYLNETGLGMEIDSVSDEELESMFADDETPEKRTGALNLPTAAGLSLIFVGMVYLFQQLGFGFGPDLSVIISMLPWLAGILIILVGFGLLSRKPRKKKVRVKMKRGFDLTGRARGAFEILDGKGGKKRLTRSVDKKVAGVCGGIAEYFSLDPTLIRIAFVIGTLISSGSFVVAYIVLAMVMPNPDDMKKREERITIIRDR